jgi:3-dehydroquinate dehydratase II
MSRCILVLLGPNLSSLSDKLENQFDAPDTEFTFIQANSEGLLIDALEEESFDGILVNAGAISPLCFGLAEAIALSQKPCVEALLNPIPKERGVSALTSISIASIVEGESGHVKAFNMLLEKIPAGVSTSSTSARSMPSPKGKTIGRKVLEATNSIEEDGPKGKSIGRRNGQAVPSKNPSSSGLLTRSLVAQKIHARLKGSISAAELSSWARTSTPCCSR